MPMFFLLPRGICVSLSAPTCPYAYTKCSGKEKEAERASLYSPCQPSSWKEEEKEDKEKEEEDRKEERKQQQPSACFSVPSPLPYKEVHTWGFYRLQLSWLPPGATTLPILSLLGRKGGASLPSGNKGGRWRRRHGTTTIERRCGKALHVSYAHLYRRRRNTAITLLLSSLHCLILLPCATL